MVGDLMEIPHGVIAEIKSNSIAEELGIEKGDKLIEVNGVNPEDLIDISFLLADEYVELVIEKANGEEWVLEIEKEYNEDIGVIFENSTFDGINRCQNKCIFCFVDQMPPSLRQSLYVKDDDYRMSFLHGNFVTMTNLNPENVSRIIKYHLSPLYISVHSTNGELRKTMLNNNKAANIESLLSKLASAGIEMHTQIVLVPEVNDRNELDRTISDLAKLWPQVRSIAVVPVGLTKFRTKLSPIRSFTENEAIQVIKQVEVRQEQFRQEFDYPLVFLADEFYVNGKMKLPATKSYEDFPQLENGVGLVRLFLDSFKEQKKYLPDKFSSLKKVTFITGVSAAKIIQEVTNELKFIQNLNVSIKVIVNHFFGETVTVAGLVTGSDIIEQCKSVTLGDFAFIPSVMLKSGEKVFIDGTSIEHLEKEIGVPVIIVDLEHGAKDLVTKLQTI